MSSSLEIRKHLLLGGLLAAGVVLLGSALPGAAEEPAAAGGAVNSADTPMLRRLTQEQYRNVIRDVFGSSIVVTTQFDPDLRDKQTHLIAVGTSETTITGSTLENYHRTAGMIAAQVLEPARREYFVPCKPASETAWDETCARRFIAAVGRGLFRRPLDSTELDKFDKAGAEATRHTQNFHASLQLVLTGLLEAPEFLFRGGESTAVDSRNRRLDGFARASRLSFFLWNSSPDEDLLNAAERGELESASGIARQVDRMLSSRRAQAGVRAFFADMLALDGLAVVQKDHLLYPHFVRVAVPDFEEQTLRTIIDHVITRDGDYRDLFTTRRTFLTPRLGSIYNVPVITDNQFLEEWTPYEFPADVPQAGILTHASLLTLHSNPGRTAPTLRGKAVREHLFCQKVPDPPGNVDFSNFEDSKNPAVPTARARLDAHSANPVCAGCHKITDPIGFGLENFDTTARYRQVENGTRIDPSGKLDGIDFKDAAELGRAIHANPNTTSCLVKRLYSYATGRAPTAEESDWLAQSPQAEFMRDKYRFMKLMRRIALSPQFYAGSDNWSETKASGPAVAGRVRG